MIRATLHVELSSEKKETEIFSGFSLSEKACIKTSAAAVSVCVCVYTYGHGCVFD